MIGIILWSDPDAEQAVIWCEENGELAFLSHSTCSDLPRPFLDVGDVVECGTSKCHRSQHVTHIKRTGETHDVSHPRPLKEPTTPKTLRLGLLNTAEIIPFQPKTKPAHPARHKHKSRKRG